MAPYQVASPFAYEMVWPWNESKFPCTCCPATQALEYGVWTCSESGREWTQIGSDEQFWGDIVENEIAAQRAAETPEQRAKRLAAEAAQEKEHEVNYEVSRMYGHAQMCAAKNAVRVKGSREVVIRKVDKPCKWLYCDEKVPKSQWRKDEHGTLCAPLRNFITGSQCWGHEFVNPKTGKLEKPHKCAHLHPGEAGWKAEWEKDRHYNPAMQAGTTVWMSTRTAAPVKPAVMKESAW